MLLIDELIDRYRIKNLEFGGFGLPYIDLRDLCGAMFSRHRPVCENCASQRNGSPAGCDVFAASS